MSSRDYPIILSNRNNCTHPCDPGQFGFQTTAELDDLTEIIGQERAMDALRFGAGIRREGYNLFVLGPSGTGKRSMVRQFLEQTAGNERHPSDWCYVNNFAQRLTAWSMAAVLPWLNCAPCFRTCRVRPSGSRWREQVP